METEIDRYLRVAVPKNFERSRHKLLILALARALGKFTRQSHADTVGKSDMN